MILTLQITTIYLWLVTYKYLIYQNLRHHSLAYCKIGFIYVNLFQIWWRDISHLWKILAEYIPGWPYFYTIKKKKLAVIFTRCNNCITNAYSTINLELREHVLSVSILKVGAQYATGDQWRNNSIKNEGMEPMKKQYAVVDVTGDRSKVQWCKEQYCIGPGMLGLWMKANWKWSNRRWQEWTLTF